MVLVHKIQNSNNLSKLNYKKSYTPSFAKNENKQDAVELSNNENKSKKWLITSLGIAAAAVGAVVFFKKKGLVSLIKNNKNIIEDETSAAQKVVKDVVEKIDENIPAYSLKTAKECIKKLFGEIPTETNALEKFVKTPWVVKGEGFNDYVIPDLPLQVAAHYGDNDLVKLFLEHGADINHAGLQEETALHAATRKGHLDTVKLLLDNGADMNAVYNKTYRSDTVYAAGRDAHAIELAAENGHNHLIEFFIEKGVDINRIDHYGNTPISLAAENGHFKTVDLLIKKGLNVNTQNGLKQNALHKASLEGHVEIVKLLLKNGADAKLIDDCGRNALICAARNGHKNIVDILLKHGLDIDSANEVGLTSLHLCSGWHKNKDLAEFLLEKGANINALSNSKKTPLDEAISNKHNDLINLLKSKGAKTGNELTNINQ